jgi:SAM-dependent methyltransferase
MSRRFISEAIEGGAKDFIDVGGGASSLVDHLLDLGLEKVAVLDISETALDIAKSRLGDRASEVDWIVGDVVTFEDLGRFDVWHDRAGFHFLTDPEDRERYVRLAARTLRPGGTAIMATFAPDGPDQCSGLNVCRYDAEQLAVECGEAFRLVGSQRYVHTTPRGVPQRYLYSTFQRAA